LKNKIVIKDIRTKNQEPRAKNQKTGPWSQDQRARNQYQRQQLRAPYPSADGPKMIRNKMIVERSSLYCHKVAKLH